MTRRHPTSRITAPPPDALPWWLLAPLAGLGGLVASLAYAPFGVWPAAVLGVAVVAWAVSRAASWPAAVAVGGAYGLLHMGTSLVWQSALFLESYAGLVALGSSWLALVGFGLWATRGLRWSIVAGAAVWSLAEWLSSVLPFGGFAWMRLGYSQVDSPLAGFYPFLGAAGVSFLVAALGHVAAAEVGRWDRATMRGALFGAIVLGLGWAGTSWMPDAATDDPTVPVGWVQGGAPGGGVYGLGPARTITFNQRDETLRLADRVDAGALPRPAVVVWPENSTDLDPRRDAETAAAVDAAAARAGVPLLVGSIFTEPARDERRTVAVWWDADGPGEYYAKRNLVPFGEWVPFREQLLPLIPVLRYVGAQSVPGQAPGVLTRELPGVGLLRVGVGICYEVIYPETLYDAARAGAQVMVVQSSNAMYQRTNQIDQQFAITRVRAAEMRRDVLVVTTSGLSGHIGPRGEVLERVPYSVAASGVTELPRATHLTPAVHAGRFVEGVLVAAGLVGVLTGLSGLGRRRPDATMEVDAESVGSEE